MGSERQRNETKRDYLNRMRTTDKALSGQVQRNEMSVASGDAMAKIAGVVEEKPDKIKKNDRI